MAIADSEQYLRNISLKRDSVPSFEDYPFCIPAIRHLHTLSLHPKVTYFVGDNGTGKSTLLEAIAVAIGFNPEGGSRNLRFSTRDSHSELCDYIGLCRGLKKWNDGYFLRAESFFNVATQIEHIDSDPDHQDPKISAGLPVSESYGKRSLHEQSHGEAFMTLLTKRFNGNGLYLLDEPEAALSPLRQLSVLSLMHDLIKRNSQFIIVTHSPILMAYPNATIYQFSTDSITPVEYSQTEHFTITKDFLNQREAMLKVLLSDY